MLRYSDYCQKVGLAPQWANVYNSVHVTLENTEFGEISKREVELAKYLDMVSSVQVHGFLTINDHYSFDAIVDAGRIGVASAQNNQTSKTPLHLENNQENLQIA